MSPLYDYVCPKCKATFETPAPREAEIMPCKLCDEYAVRVEVQKPGYRTDHFY
jgi:hypothetical protein